MSGHKVGPYDPVRWLKVLQAMGSDWPVAANPTDGHRRGASKACYRNAWRAADGHGLAYCEGWAYDDSGAPVQHAWNLTPDGCAVELTLRAPAGRYFGAVVPLPVVAEVTAQRGSHGPVLDVLEA